MTAPVKLRRTVVFIEAIDDGGVMRCIVAGVPDRDLRVLVPVSDLPAPLRPDAAPERVFFAYANLSAQTPAELRLERIEDHWGDTSSLQVDQMNIYRKLSENPARRLHDMALDCADETIAQNLTALYQRWEAIETAEDLLILIAFVNRSMYVPGFGEHVDLQSLHDVVDDVLNAVAGATTPVE